MDTQLFDLPRDGDASYDMLSETVSACQFDITAGEVGPYAVFVPAYDVTTVQV